MVKVPACEKAWVAVTLPWKLLPALGSVTMPGLVGPPSPQSMVAVCVSELPGSTNEAPKEVLADLRISSLHCR
jgi:hypothetical protein